MTHEAAINNASTVGESFIEVFYNCVDKRRQDVPQLYDENSTVVWNGVAARGKAMIAQLFQSLPPSKHRVLLFDCQPVIVDGTPGASLPVSVTASGNVKFGSEPEQRFSHTVLLFPKTPGTNNYYAVNDCYRLLGE